MWCALFTTLATSKLPARIQPAIWVTCQSRFVLVDWPFKVPCKNLVACTACLPSISECSDLRVAKFRIEFPPPAVFLAWSFDEAGVQSSKTETKFWIIIFFLPTAETEPCVTYHTSGGLTDWKGRPAYLLQQVASAAAQEAGDTNVSSSILALDPVLDLMIWKKCQQCRPQRSLNNPWLNRYPVGGQAGEFWEEFAGLRRKITKGAFKIRRGSCRVDCELATTRTG